MSTRAWSPALTLATIITFAVSGVFSSDQYPDLGHAKAILDKRVESMTCKQSRAFLQQLDASQTWTSSANGLDGTAGVEIHTQLKEGLDDNCTKTKETIRQTAFHAWEARYGGDLSVSFGPHIDPCQICNLGCSDPLWCPICCQATTPSCYTLYGFHC